LQKSKQDLTPEQVQQLSVKEKAKLYGKTTSTEKKTNEDEPTIVNAEIGLAAKPESENAPAKQGKRRLKIPEVVNYLTIN
jgi:hypothetical protein